MVWTTLIQYVPFIRRYQCKMIPVCNPNRNDSKGNDSALFHIVNPTMVNPISDHCELWLKKPVETNWQRIPSFRRVSYTVSNHKKQIHNNIRQRMTCTCVCIHLMYLYFAIYQVYRLCGTRPLSLQPGFPIPELVFLVLFNFFTPTSQERHQPIVAFEYVPSNNSIVSSI